MSGSPAGAWPTTSTSTSPSAPNRTTSPAPTPSTPRTAVEILTSALAREDTATSVTSEQRAAKEPALLLRKQIAQYLDALDVAGQSLVGPENLARLTARAEQIVPGVTDCDAWPALQSQLIMIGLERHQPLRHAPARTRPTGPRQQRRPSSGPGVADTARTTTRQHHGPGTTHRPEEPRRRRVLAPVLRPPPRTHRQARRRPPHPGHAVDVGQRAPVGRTTRRP